MRGKILKTLIIASALFCVSISIPLKTNALPKSDVNTTVNQYVSNKTMTVNEAKDAVMNADGDYINKVLGSKKNAVLNYDRQIPMMNIKQFYDIIDEPCYVFSLTYDYSDLFTAADSIYYVGKNSKRVYVINGTNAPAYAYEVAYNRKVNSFIYKGSDNCLQWHN